MFYVYILRCNNNAYYTGHTDDLEKRLIQHQSGNGSAYTASHLPVRLVFNELFESRDTAFLMEQQIKKWSRLKKEALINGNFKLISQFAKKKF